MRLLRNAFIATTILALSTIAPTHAAKKYPDAPLLEGTKVVAGDGQDEFFIVADTDVYQVKEPEIKSIDKEDKEGLRKPQAKIIVADKSADNKQPVPMKEPMKPADVHQTAQAIKFALNKMAENKTDAPIKPSINNELARKVPVPVNIAEKHNTPHQSALAVEAAINVATKMEMKARLASKKHISAPPSATHIALLAAKKAKAPISAIESKEAVHKTALASNELNKELKTKLTEPKMHGSPNSTHVALLAAQKTKAPITAIEPKEAGHKTVLASDGKLTKELKSKLIEPKMQGSPNSTQMVLLAAQKTKASINAIESKEGEHKTVLASKAKLHKEIKTKLAEPKMHGSPKSTQLALLAAQKIKAPHPTIESKETLQKTALASNEKLNKELKTKLTEAKMHGSPKTTHIALLAAKKAKAQIRIDDREAMHKPLLAVKEKRRHEKVKPVKLATLTKMHGSPKTTHAALLAAKQTKAPVKIDDREAIHKTMLAMEGKLANEKGSPINLAAEQKMDDAPSALQAALATSKQPKLPVKVENSEAVRKTAHAIQDVLKHEKEKNNKLADQETQGFHPESAQNTFVVVHRAKELSETEAKEVLRKTALAIQDKQAEKEKPIQLAEQKDKRIAKRITQPKIIVADRTKTPKNDVDIKTSARKTAQALQEAFNKQKEEMAQAEMNKETEIASQPIKKPFAIAHQYKAHLKTRVNKEKVRKTANAIEAMLDQTFEHESVHRAAMKPNHRAIDKSSNKKLAKKQVHKNFMPVKKIAYKTPKFEIKPYTKETGIKVVIRKIPASVKVAYNRSTGKYEKKKNMVSLSHAANKSKPKNIIHTKIHTASHAYKPHTNNKIFTAKIALYTPNVKQTKKQPFKKQLARSSQSKRHNKVAGHKSLTKTKMALN